MADPMQEVHMEIRGLMLDPASNVPIVILRETQGDLLLPIWIGTFEANAIALRIEGVEPPRPMTHDLLLSLLETLETRVTKVVICDLRESTFFALVHLEQGERSLTVDSRPSDALALALRASAPIYVLRDVLERARAADLAAESSDDDRLRKWLEEIRPEDLGKYTM